MSFSENAVAYESNGVRRPPLAAYKNPKII